MAKCIQKWVADDGSEFNSEKAADDHNEQKVFQELYAFAPLQVPNGRIGLAPEDNLVTVPYVDLHRWLRGSRDLAERMLGKK